MYSIYFFSSVTRNKRRRFRPITDSDTELRGSYSAPDWLRQQQLSDGGRGLCCSWEVHDSLIWLWPTGSRTPRLLTQCGLILSRFGPSGVKASEHLEFLFYFIFVQGFSGGETFWVCLEKKKRKKKRKEISNFFCELDQFVFLLRLKWKETGSWLKRHRRHDGQWWSVRGEEEEEARPENVSCCLVFSACVLLFVSPQGMKQTPHCSDPAGPGSARRGRGQSCSPPPEKHPCNDYHLIRSVVLTFSHSVRAVWWCMKGVRRAGRGSLPAASRELKPRPPPQVDPHETEQKTND